MVSFSKKIILISCAVIIAIAHSSVSQAISLDDYYSDQGNLWYDERAESYTCTPTNSDTNVPVVTGENEKTIYQYFIGKGFSPEQSAGIVGNLGVESAGTFDPRIHQGGGGIGRGIAQWSSTGRWVELVAFARSQNRSEWDLMVQLDFIWKEQQSTEKASYDDLIKMTTVETAVHSFMVKYERPGEPHEPERVTYALAAFQKYSGLAGIGGSASGGGCGGSIAGGGTIVQVAEAEFAKGISEQPPQCDNGNPSINGSCGAEIDKYTDSTLEYWCADFVSWVYNAAGKPFTGGASGGWRIASVSSVKSWFQQNGIFFLKNDTTNKPMPGDVVIYSYSHTDIVVAVNATSIVTIGGNTGIGSSNNGNGVGKKTRDIKDPTIVGYGRLK